MKIALAQRNYIVGDFEYNTGLILDSISQAKSEGADLVIFSELSVCGYPPRDFLEFSDFRSKCEEAVAAIASECCGIAAIVGAPSMNPGSNGKPLYNTAFFLADGQVGGMAHKTSSQTGCHTTSLNSKGNGWQSPFVKTSGTWMTIRFM